MQLRRHKDSERSVAQERTTYAPGWAVPPAFSFARDVLDVLARDPVRLALIHVGSDGTVDVRTFVDMARESARWAHLLLERAPEPGSRVVIALEPGTAWAASILGALRVGLIPVPVGVGHGSEGLAARMVQVEPALVLLDHRSEPAVHGALPRLRDQPSVLALEEAQWALMRAGEPIDPVVRPVESPAVVLFTRGASSRRPRPVLHAHASTFAAHAVARDWLDVGPEDTVWCDADGGSDTALWCGLFGPWAAGGVVLALDRQLEPAERADLLERFQPTVMVAAPDRHAAFLDLVDRQDVRLTGLRNAGSTGAPLLPELVTRFRERTGVTLLDGYSTVETGTIVFQRPGAEQRPGSLGLPATGQLVAPVDALGFPSETGTIGDLGVYGRPPSLCSGYWIGWPPSEEVVGDSWTLTGDRAHADQDGNLWLDGGPSAEVATPGFLLSRASPEVLLEAAPAVRRD